MMVGQKITIRPAARLSTPAKARSPRPVPGPDVAATPRSTIPCRVQNTPDDEREQDHGDVDVPQAVQPGQGGQQADEDVGGPGAAGQAARREPGHQPEQAADQQRRAQQVGHDDDRGLGPHQQDHPGRQRHHRDQDEHLPGRRPGDGRLPLVKTRAG